LHNTWDYTDYLFPKRSDSGGKAHQKTLSIYLGLGSPEALTRLEIAYESARDEYRFESRRVTTNAQGLREKIEKLEEELRRIAERLQAIEQGQSVLVDPAYLTRVQEQIGRRRRPGLSTCTRSPTGKWPQRTAIRKSSFALMSSGR
jgi:hypothetical protein